jgi:hypothetical protein
LNSVVFAQPPATATDPEIAEGIRLAETGEYDQAIVTLDSAAHRLEGSTDKAPELAEAYLYLGVAYLAKGHETSAKARFRDAIARVRGLRIDSTKFAPKVVELFEQARQEIGAVGPAPAPSPTAQAQASPAPSKGGSKTIWLVAGGAAVAGGVALLVAGGGGSSAAGPGSGCTTTTVTVPASSSWTHTGATLVAGNRLTISASGTWNGDAGFGECGPDGVGQPCGIFGNNTCPMQGGTIHSLIGRIAFGTPFQVGSGFTTTATVAGALDLGMNYTSGANAGALTATITVCPQ